MASISEQLKEQVRERASRCCEYCLSQEAFSPSSFSIEHIIPVSKGGKDTPNNLALSCQGCNAHKYNKIESLDPISKQLVMIYNPRIDLNRERVIEVWQLNV